MAYVYDAVYNALGEVITDTRVIATKSYVTGYLYNASGTKRGRYSLFVA